MSDQILEETMAKHRPNPPTRTEYPPLWAAIVFVVAIAVIVAFLLWVIAL